MALKTGTTNDVKDVATYGLLPQPTSKNAPAIAVGVWMGNSNHASPNFTDIERFSTDTAGKIWRSFMRDLTRGWPVVDFQRPKGLVRATIDSFTGGKPGPWTSAYNSTKTEWFIAGTEPGSKGAVDPPGLLYDKRCGIYLVDLANGDGKDAPTPGRQRRDDTCAAVGCAGGPSVPAGSGCYVAPTPKPGKNA